MNMVVLRAKGPEAAVEGAFGEVGAFGVAGEGGGWFVERRSSQCEVIGAKERVLRHGVLALRGGGGKE